MIGGKIENPFYKLGKNELIWDSDLTPEGVALTYGMPLGEQTTLNWAAGGFWVNEESSGGDTSLWGIQGHLKHQIDKPTYILGGASMFCYGNIQGEESLADEWNDDGDEFFGNTAAPGDVYALDYDLFELFAEFGTEVAKLPVAVFGDYVRNTVADDEDTGWLVGVPGQQGQGPRLLAVRVRLPRYRAGRGRRAVQRAPTSSAAAPAAKATDSPSATWSPRTWQRT